jgi:hypothetical protein
MASAATRMRRWPVPGVLAAAALLAGVPSPVAAAPTAGAPAAPTARAAVQLHVIDTTCQWQNDTFGSDEPYLLVNGVRVWSGTNVDYDDVESIEFTTGFDEVVELQLWEDDGGITGGDDHIATWYIFASEAGTGVHTVQSPWENRPGLYDLRYEVV